MQRHMSCPLIPVVILGQILVGSGCKPQPNEPKPVAVASNSKAEVPQKAGSLQGPLAELVDRLDKAGFYKFCESPQTVQEAKRTTREQGYLYPSQIKRTHPMNSQTLSWGGVQDFLERSKPLFELRKIALGEVTQVTYISDAYYVFVFGEEYQIYSEEETYSDKHQDLTVKRTLQMCNKVLKEKGSDEQMYVVNKGLEGMAVFLTPEQFDIIRQSSVSESEKPMSAEMILPTP